MFPTSSKKNRSLKTEIRRDSFQKKKKKKKKVQSLVRFHPPRNSRCVRGRPPRLPVPPFHISGVTYRPISHPGIVQVDVKFLLRSIERNVVAGLHIASRRQSAFPRHSKELKIPARRQGLKRSGMVLGEKGNRGQGTGARIKRSI